MWGRCHLMRSALSEVLHTRRGWHLLLPAPCIAAAHFGRVLGEARCSRHGKTTRRGPTASGRAGRRRSSRAQIMTLRPPLGPNSWHGGLRGALLLTLGTGASAYDDTGAGSPVATSCTPLLVASPAMLRACGSGARGACGSPNRFAFGPASQARVRRSCPDDPIPVGRSRTGGRCLERDG